MTHSLYLQREGPQGGRHEWRGDKEVQGTEEGGKTGRKGGGLKIGSG